MERVSWNKKIIILFVLIGFFEANRANGIEGSFPESQFGSPPSMPVELGIGPGYVSHAVSDLDGGSGDQTENSPKRAPAGLEFRGKQASQPSRPTAVASSPAKKSEIQPDQSSANGKVDLSQTAPLPDADDPLSPARKGVQEIALIAGDLGFFPRTVFVSRDVPVRLFVTGASKNTLCLMMDSFQVRKQIRSQKIEEVTFTPTTPGKYRFYCPVNGMEGILIVKELTSTIPD